MEPGTRKRTWNEYVYKLGFVLACVLCRHVRVWAGFACVRIVCCSAWRCNERSTHGASHSTHGAWRRHRCIKQETTPKRRPETLHKREREREQSARAQPHLRGLLLDVALHLGARKRAQEQRGENLGGLLQRRREKLVTILTTFSYRAGLISSPPAWQCRGAPCCRRAG
jgi:hypothetical protein